MRNNEAIAKSAKPAPHTNAEKRYGHTHALPRVHTVQPSENKERRVTKNMAKGTPILPRVPPTAVQRVKKTASMAQDDLPLNNLMITRNKVLRRRRAQARPTVSKSAPVRNTRSQTRTTTTAASRTRPSTRSSKRLSQLMWNTSAKRNRTKMRCMYPRVGYQCQLKGCCISVDIYDSVLTWRSDQPTGVLACPHQSFSANLLTPKESGSSYWLV